MNFWSQVVAEYYKDSFKVETWLRNSTEVPDCTGYKVELIGTVKFCDSACTQFTET